MHPLLTRQLKKAGLSELVSRPESEMWLGLLGRVSQSYAEARFEAGDAFLFGAETAGLPAAMLAWFATDRVLRLPMRPGNRSLNLSNSVAVVVFEAWRQQGYDGGA